MKPRFFADTRDLFKYDLVLHLMEEVPDLRHFLFVPMLTEDDGKEGGYHDLSKARAGYLNKELYHFLEHCHAEKVRDVNRIRSWFAGRGIETTVVDVPFTHRGRNRFFENLATGVRPSSLILLDPDNGLEVGHPDEKHLLFSELMAVLDAMEEGSIVMVFQYYPRVDHAKYRAGREAEISRRTGVRPAWITDNQVIFYVLAKKEQVMDRVSGVLRAYASRYPGITVGS